jgi:hypothetical protein
MVADCKAEAKYDLPCTPDLQSAYMPWLLAQIAEEGQAKNDRKALESAAGDQEFRPVGRGHGARGAYVAQKRGSAVTSSRTTER